MCLQVVAECGIVASTGIRLPFCHNARRVCAEETSFFSVHAANEGADAEGTTTTALGISTDRSEHILSLLLLASDVVRYILYGGDFVVGQCGSSALPHGPRGDFVAGTVRCPRVSWRLR